MTAKQRFLFIVTVMLIFLSTGCTINDRPVVQEEEIRISMPSEKRMNELVEANNTMLNLIYGESTFFSTAEIKCHMAEFYTQEVVDKYITSGIFYEEEGRILSRITVDEDRVNLATMEYEVLKSSIYIAEEVQTFSVRFFNDSDFYIVQFSSVYDTSAQEWFLTDIAI